MLPFSQFDLIHSRYFLVLFYDMKFLWNTQNLKVNILTLFIILSNLHNNLISIGFKMSEEIIDFFMPNCEICLNPSILYSMIIRIHIKKICSVKTCHWYLSICLVCKFQWFHRNIGIKGRNIFIGVTFLSEPSTKHDHLNPWSPPPQPCWWVREINRGSYIIQNMYGCSTH